MHRNLSIVKYCVLAAAAGACAAAIVLRPPEQEIEKLAPPGSPAAYLDCGRLPDQVPEPDLEAPCSLVAGDAAPWGLA